jgi:Vacuolar protein sorting-associated protein 62
MPRVLVLLVLVVLVTLRAGAAPSGAASRALGLLETYEPVLFFHASEDWAPEPVETFLADARLEQQVAKGSWNTVSGPLPTSNSGCTQSPCYRLNLPCRLHGGDACYERMPVRTGQWRRPVVYGRVVAVPPGSAPAPGFTKAPKYLVRYWLFYEFDDYHTLRERMWQAHEGDWESISIAIDADAQPQFAAYSQHCSGTVRAWSTVERRGTTHPVAYVALGSHANYFTNTPSSTRFTECLKSGTASATVTRITRLAQEKIVDRTGTAHPLGPPGTAGMTPLRIVPLDPASLAWARFPGRWSEGQLLWLGTTPRPFASVSQGYGPATPRWTSTTVPSLWHIQSS